MGMDQRLLGIYLNDHLAGAIAGEEVTRRCLSRNRGTPLGQYLEHLLTEIRDDRLALERLMTRLGLAKNPVKEFLGFLVDKAGWLKFNGRLLSYSDLSRLEELEGLCLSVEGKLSMWRALGHVAASDSRLDPTDIAMRIERARREREELEAHRLEAARIALSGSDQGKSPAG